MGVKSVPFFSGSLFGRKSCMVYVPDGYDQNNRQYPVVYLLHGLNGSESDWTEKGGAHLTVESMAGEGKMPECIVVMPNDGEYGHGTFYMDWYDGTGNFEQYIICDLIPFIDSTYRTMATREGRAVCGLSMGGYGAVMLALKNPEVFGSAASLSGALASLKHMPLYDYSRSDFGRMLGPQHGAYAEKYDIYDLSAKMRIQERRPAIYFNCGRGDYLFDFNQAFNLHLENIGYGHRMEQFEGEHNWDYWKKHLPDALAFLNSCLPHLQR